VIAPGSTCISRQTGNALWIVKRQELDGRWRIVGKTTDRRGYPVLTARTAGENDLTVIFEVPVLTIGAAIMHNGMEHVVAADLGNAVELVVPPHTYQTHGGVSSRRGRARTKRSGKPRRTRRGVNLHIAGGNVAAIPKADIVMENHLT